MCVYKKKKVIFIHIPKCGGTYLRQALKLPTAIGDINVDHATPFSPHVKKYWEEYFTFTFVRNPYSRLVSAFFFDKMRIKQISTKTKGNIRREASRFDDSKEGFEKFVKKFLPLDFNNNRKYIPISHIIKDAEFDFIGKLENLNEDVATLNKIIHKGKLDLKKKKLDKNQSSHKAFDYYYQNKEFKQMVYDYYQKDFERFNYEK